MDSFTLQFKIIIFRYSALSYSLIQSKHLFQCIIWFHNFLFKIHKFSFFALALGRKFLFKCMTIHFLLQSRIIFIALPFIFLAKDFLRDLCSDKLVTILWRYFSVFHAPYFYFRYNLSSLTFCFVVRRDLCWGLTFGFLRLFSLKIVAVKNYARYLEKSEPPRSREARLWATESFSS